MEHLNPQNSKTVSPRISLFFWFLVPLIVGTLAWYRVSPRSVSAHTVEGQHELAKQAAEWVRAERDHQRPLAVPLTSSELELFGPFFPRQILENTRVLEVEELPAPPFVDAIRHRGRRVFDFSRARGLALDDTILLRGTDVQAGSLSRQSILFHELVHVVQFHALGVDSFLQHYFASLVATGYSYPEIVFEHQAFELQRRFTQAPDQPFSVGLEVEGLVASLKEAP